MPGDHMKRTARVITLLLVLSTFLPFAASSAAPLLSAPRIPVKNGTSTNWSGYAIETNLSTPQSKVATDVRGQWVVPSVTCGTGNTYSSIWVGIDGYSSNSVEQT